ncbi:unnamed protein product [Parascedosporium putredinis]|uniref:HORMA domain-containing protein n=1 Tax=Parascedosporium putredinis TaxID=1442378 RepID=A0A9P1M7S1_9PEZI|nr:unnamed protein product [Parascedosporium putredinis]CAI7987973.1 unnamed protein product [Parascedosporium putredinis]
MASTNLPPPRPPPSSPASPPSSPPPSTPSSTTAASTPETFLTTRSHNLPIHQSRHPALCAWIADAVAAAAAQIRSASVRRVALVLHAPPALAAAVVERWVFDLDGWPRFPDAQVQAQAHAPDDPKAAEDSVNWVDVQEQLRGALMRVSYAAERLGPLPKDCTFTVAVELNDEAPAPIEPNLQPATRSRSQPGKDVGGGPRPSGLSKLGLSFQPQPAEITGHALA